MAGLAANHDRVDPGPVELAEIVQPPDGPLGELRARPDHGEVIAAVALVERQRQTPKPAAGDVPVTHVGEPVGHAGAGVVRDPADLGGGGEHPRPDLVHADEPLVIHAKHELFAAAPAMRVAMRIDVLVVEDTGLEQMVGDVAGDHARITAGEEPVALDIAAVLVDRDEHRQPVLAAELEILLAGPGRDVHDAGAFVGADVGPGNDAVLDALNRREIVERAKVGPVEQLAARQPPDFAELAPHRPLNGRRGEIVVGARLLDLDIFEVGVDRGGHVRGQRPRRRGPHEQRGHGLVGERQPDDHRVVLDLLVCVDQLVLRKRGAAARAPGHGPVRLDDPAALVTRLEEVPDVLDVLVGVREVGVRPIHPLPESDRLVGLDSGVSIHPLAAAVGEFGDAVRFDVALGVEPKLPLDLDFEPQSLGVEPVLVALVIAAHGPVALVDVLVGASPGVMHAHRVVGGDWPVEERPARAVPILLPQLLERAVLVPEFEDPALHRREVKLRRQLTKRARCVIPRHATAPVRARSRAAG